LYFLYLLLLINLYQTLLKRSNGTAVVIVLYKYFLLWSGMDWGYI